MVGGLDPDGNCVADGTPKRFAASATNEQRLQFYIEFNAMGRGRAAFACVFIAACPPWTTTAQWTGPSASCGQVGKAPDGINTALNPT